MKEEGESALSPPVAAAALKWSWCCSSEDTQRGRAEGVKGGQEQHRDAAKAAARRTARSPLRAGRDGSCFGPGGRGAASRGTGRQVDGPTQECREERVHHSGYVGPGGKARRVPNHRRKEDITGTDDWPQARLFECDSGGGRGRPHEADSAHGAVLRDVVGRRGEGDSPVQGEGEPGAAQRERIPNTGCDTLAQGRRLRAAGGTNGGGVLGEEGGCEQKQGANRGFAEDSDGWDDLRRRGDD
eukprot:scaffold8845_cov120-Isochrysis_galbana.AAC.5